MDKQTKIYRINQFKNIFHLPENYNYAPKIKIITPNGESTWLDITQEEFLNIKEILTGSI